MNRRDFIQTLGLATIGSLLTFNEATAKSKQIFTLKRFIKLSRPIHSTYFAGNGTVYCSSSHSLKVVHVGQAKIDIKSVKNDYPFRMLSLDRQLKDLGILKITSCSGNREFDLEVDWKTDDTAQSMPTEIKVMPVYSKDNKLSYFLLTEWENFESALDNIVRCG